MDYERLRKWASRALYTAWFAFALGLWAAFTYAVVLILTMIGAN